MAHFGLDLTLEKVDCLSRVERVWKVLQVYSFYGNLIFMKGPYTSLRAYFSPMRHLITEGNIQYKTYLMLNKYSFS